MDHGVWVWVPSVAFLTSLRTRAHTLPTAYGLIYLFTYLIVASEPGGGSVDHDTGGDARPQPGTGPTAAGDGALSAPPLPACCAQRRRCRANPDVADHVRRRGARGRGVLQLPCRVRACCRGRAGRSASLPAVATVARAANRGPRRAAERAGIGAIEVAAGVSVEELGAPLPAPALAEDRRTPALHAGTLHLAVRATSGGFGTRALSGVSCGD